MGHDVWWQYLAWAYRTLATDIPDASQRGRREWTDWNVRPTITATLDSHFAPGRTGTGEGRENVGVVAPKKGRLYGILPAAALVAEEH